MLGEVRSRWVAGHLATGLPIQSKPARAVGFPCLAGLTSLPLPSWLSHRTLKRKSSSMKRLSPAPQLGPSSDSHTSYYSESVVRESYIGSPRAASLARSALLDDRLHSERLHSEPYWSKYPRPPPEAWSPSSFPLSVPKRPFLRAPLSPRWRLWELNRAPSPARWGPAGKEEERHRRLGKQQSQRAHH